jgi:hypothetical protein
MLTPPKHLIPPLVFPEVLVNLIVTVDYSIYLIWKLISSADFSVYLTGHTDFDCGFFCLPDWTH